MWDASLLLRTGKPVYRSTRFKHSLDSSLLLVSALIYGAAAAAAADTGEGSGSGSGSDCLQAANDGQTCLDK